MFWGLPCDGQVRPRLLFLVFRHMPRNTELGQCRLMLCQQSLCWHNISRHWPNAQLGSTNRVCRESDCGSLLQRATVWFPAYTTHVGLMLVHRMRRRPNTKSKWGECILSDMNVYRDAILSKHDTETNAGFTLAHCLPCWRNIKPALAQRIILCWDDPGILSLSWSVVLAQPQTRWQGHRS